MPESNDPMAVDRLVNLPMDPDTATDTVANGPHRWLSFLRSRWDVLLAISAGGALGSLARWGVGALVPWTGSTFPWATFIENISGGFALGALMVFVLDVWPPRRYLRPFLGVGVLGGYSRAVALDGPVVSAGQRVGEGDVVVVGHKVLDLDLDMEVGEGSTHLVEEGHEASRSVHLARGGVVIDLAVGDQVMQSREGHQC